MNKKEIKNLIEAIDNPEIKVGGGQAQELLVIAENLKQTRKNYLPDENFKAQLGEKLYKSYLTQRKEKNMQIVEQPVKKTAWWKNWKVMVPATLVLLLAIFTSVWFMGKPDEDTNSKVASGASALLSFKQGEVQYQDGDGEWIAAETDMLLKEGMRVRTDSKSKAIIDFADGSIARVDEASEMEIGALTDTKVALNQLAGTSYHRVKEGTGYQVAAGDSVVTARGTAFGVEGTKDISVPVLDSQVSIELKQGNTVVTSKTVVAGKEGIVDTAQEKIEIKDLSEEKLAKDWYLWNIEKDQDKDYAVYKKKSTEGPMLKVTEPASGTEVKISNLVLKGVTDPEAIVTVNGAEVENKDGSFEKALTLSEGDNIIKVQAVNKDGNETILEVKIKYTKEEEVDETDESDKQEETSTDSLSLSVAAKSDGVHLTWVKFNGELTYYKVVRSETNPNLKYPDDGYIKVITDINTTTMIDADVKGSTSYYYRICAVNTAKEVICGNVMQVTALAKEEVIAKTSVMTSAQATLSGVNIFWDATGDAPKAFVIAISETSNPSFPGAIYVQKVTPDTRSYTWSGLPNKPLHIRVGAYDGSSVYVYSNDVAVTPIDENTPPTASALSAQIKADGVYLSWTKNNDPDFLYYKVVRSQTNPAPTYPADGYIKAASRDELSYVDTEVKATSTETYYYSVCTVDQSKQVTRSNVIKVVDGVIQ